VSRNVPSLTCYNLYKHGPITTVFGTNVTEKVGNQNVLCFRALPASALPEETGNPEIASVYINAVCFFSEHTPKTMWANAQGDGRPAEYRWRPMFNAAKFG